MTIRYGDKYIAVKLEPSYAMDPDAITGMDVVRAMDLTRDRYAGPRLERTYDRKSMGSYSKINASPHTTLSFGVELTAAAAAMGAPVYSDIIRACGLQEVDVNAEAAPADWQAATNYAVGAKVTKGQTYICIQAHVAAAGNAPDVAGGDNYWNDYTRAGAHKAYKPRDEGFESLRIEFWQNRNKQVFKGCRGNVQLMFEREQFPKLQFNFMGRYEKEADAAPLANINISDYRPPLPVSDANTPDFIWGAQDDLKLSALTVNLNNNLVWRDLVNLAAAKITDRKATFTMNCEAELLSKWNFADDYENHLGSIPLRTLTLRHGPKDSRYIELLSDGAQIDTTADQNSDEVLENGINGVLTPEGPSAQEFEVRYF